MPLRQLYPLRFDPIYQYRLWGGRRLGQLLSTPLPGDGPIGEAWVLSDRTDHQSVVANGSQKRSCPMLRVIVCTHSSRVAKCIRFYYCNLDMYQNSIKGVVKMTKGIASLIEGETWKALETHAAKNRSLHLRDLFAQDPTRGERLKVEAAGIYLDYSKNRITDETVKLLLQLAEDSGLRQRTDAMFRGERINVTEKRAVLHVALRAPLGDEILVDDVDVVPLVHDVLDKMTTFSNRVRSGEWKGYTGKSIRNIVNIGIGGSDLGPVMAYEALRH